MVWYIFYGKKSVSNWCFEPICYRVLQCCIFVVYFTITLKYSQLLHSSCAHFSHFRGNGEKIEDGRCGGIAERRKYFAGSFMEGNPWMRIPKIRFNCIHRGYSIRFDFIFHFILFFHHIFISFLCIHAAILHTSNYLQNKMWCSIFYMCMRVCLSVSICVCVQVNECKYVKRGEHNPPNWIFCLVRWCACKALIIKGTYEYGRQIHSTNTRYMILNVRDSYIIR